MPTPRPTMPAIGIADGETSMAPASRRMPPMPTATATRARPIGTSAATTVPNATSSTSSAIRMPTPSSGDVSSGALRNTASPPSSTRRSAVFDAVDQLGEGHEAPLAQLGRCLVEGERRVPDPAVLRDGPGREGVGHGHDVVGPGHVGQDGVDGLLLVLQRPAVVDREDDESRGPGRLGELVLEQPQGPFALAALRAEGVDEAAAAAAGEGEHGAEDDDPGRDGAPGVPRCGRGDAAGEPVHGRAFRKMEGCRGTRR